MSASNRPPHTNQEATVEWLSELVHIGQITTKIAQALLLLQKKRVTLEETMISRYLHGTAGCYGTMVWKINLALGAKQLGSGDLLDRIKDTNLQVEAAVDYLLKIIYYDQNFLEQYFEHSFLSRLTQEYGFNEKLERLNAELPMLG